MLEYIGGGDDRHPREVYHINQILLLAESNSISLYGEKTPNMHKEKIPESVVKNSILNKECAGFLMSDRKHINYNNISVKRREFRQYINNQIKLNKKSQSADLVFNN